MTQTRGDRWSVLRRPLLDPESRFAWAAPVLGQLRLRSDGREQPLEELFARILFNDADRQVLALGFGESERDRTACDVVVRLERGQDSVRLEVALSGRVAKQLALGDRELAVHPGAADAAPGVLQGPFAAVAVLHV